MEKYSLVLTQFIQSLILSSKNKQQYQYPITPPLAESLALLENALDIPDSTPIPLVHNVALALFSPRDSSQDIGDYNKWLDPLECFLAIYNLKTSGNFKEPKDVTQVFAILVYLVRGTTLYEGHKDYLIHNNYYE